MVIILATILAAFDFMDFIAAESRRKTLILKGFIGAPGTIRTCDRLVRSQGNIPYISTGCGRLFWPECPVSAWPINNLGRFFGRLTTAFLHCFYSVLCAFLRSMTTERADMECGHE